MHSLFTRKICIFFFLAAFSCANAQTVLLNPLLDGGFESGATFSANGWQTANAPTNKWYVGAGATPHSGTRCAYIDNGTGASNNYTITTAQTSHIYRDITFPANEPRIVLTFKWKGTGQPLSTTDYFTVFGMSNTLTPAPNIPSGYDGISSVDDSYAGAEILTSPAGLYSSSTWQTQRVLLPASYAGTTKRIVFMWSNNATQGSGEAVSIDSVSIVTYANITCVSLPKAGSWSDPNMWVNGFQPTDNDSAIISSGSEITSQAFAASIANVKIENNATLVTLSGFSLNNLTIDNGGVLKMYNNLGSVGTLTVKGNIINNGRIDMNMQGCTLKFDGSGTQYINGTGVFENSHIPTFLSLGTNPINISQDILVTRSLDLKGSELTGSGSVTLGDGMQSNLFTFSSNGGTIAAAKTVSGNFSLVKNISYTYSSSTPSLSYSTGNELAVSADSLNVTVNNMGANFLKLGRNLTVNNLILNDTLDLNGFNIMVSGSLSFNQSVITGAGSFTNGDRSILRISSPQGITQTTLLGNVQSGIRNYNRKGSYYYLNTSVVTGDGLPDTLTGGAVSITGAVKLSRHTVFNHLYLNSAFDADASNIRVNGTAAINNNYISGIGSFTSAPGSRLILTQSSTAGLIVLNGSAGNIRTTGGISIFPGTNINIMSALQLGNGFPATGIDTLTVTLQATINQPLTINHLVLENGATLNTNLVNPFVLNGELMKKNQGVVIGPLTRRIDSARVGSVDFPVGISAPVNQNFSLVNPVITGTHVYATVSFIQRGFTAVNGVNVTSVNQTYFWTLKVSGPGVLRSADHLKLNSNNFSGANPFDKIAVHQGNSPSGVYKSIGGYKDASGYSILSSMLDSLSQTDTNYFAVSTATGQGVFVSGTYTVGDTGTFKTISMALTEIGRHDSINGPVLIEILPGYNPARETYPIVFNGNLRTSKTSPITLRPAANVSSAIKLNNINYSRNAIVEFSQDAKYITIDGRAGGIGTNRFIEIDQTNTPSLGFAIPAVSLFDKAQYITLKYLKASAVNPTITSGVVFFGTSVLTGPDEGNSYDTIDHCVINGNANALSFGKYGVSSANGVQSIGTTGSPNRFNTITNTDIIDCYSPTAVANGSSFINIGLNNFKWTIGDQNAGNRFYYTQPVTINSVPPFTLGSQIHVIRFSNMFFNDSSLICSNEIGRNASVPNSMFIIGDSTNVITSPASFSVISTNNSATSLPVYIKANTISGLTLCGLSAKLIVATGSSLIENNTIGSATAGAIKFIGSGITQQQGLVCIAANGSGLITGNRTDGIALKSYSTSAQFSLIFNAILAESFNNQLIRVVNNKIGDLVPQSIQALPGSGKVTIEGVSLKGNSGNIMVTGNSIKNLVNQNAYKSIVNGISLTSSGSALGTTISGNSIGRFSSVSEPVAGLNISLNGAGNVVIEKNTISSLHAALTSGQATINGISIANIVSQGSTVLDRNNIHSLTSNPLNVSVVQNGILLQFPPGNSKTVSLTNNLVRLGIDEQGNSMVQPIEINAVKTENLSQARIVNNTFYIGGNNVLAGTGKTSILNVGAGNDSVANNIFYNARSNGSGTNTSHHIFKTTTTGPAYLNRNIYYANGTGNCFALWGSASLPRFQQWQAVNLNDTTGINLNPMLVNPAGDTATFDLKPSGATPAESNGSVFNSPTYDFGLKLRANFTPTDIGAYAGNFTKTDVDAPVVTAVNATNTHLRSNRMITATITDETGTAISGIYVPRVYYKKMYSGNYASARGTLINGNGRNGTWGFTIDTSLINGLNYNDSIYYFFVAQDTCSYNNLASYPLFAAANDVNNILNAPPTLFNYKIFESASGNYLVGASQTAPNFTTITAAKDFLEGRLVTGHVNFLLQADYTSASEPAFPITLTRFLSNNDSNRVTIKPDAGVNATISGDGNPAVIRLFMARNYTIDGSNNGTDTRNLTLVNTNTAVINGVVFLHGNASADADSGCTYNTIKNCIIYGNNNQSTSALTTFGVVSSGNLSGSSLCAANNNNSVVNNLIYNVTYGIHFRTGYSLLFNYGNSVRNNQVGKGPGANEMIGNCGIDLSYQNDITVSGNTVAYLHNLSTASVTRPGFGIMVNNVSRARVVKNTVHNIINEKGGVVNGLQYIGGSDSSRNMIANNVIHSLRTNGTLIGMNLMGGGYDTIVYNSCYISDSMDRMGIAASSSSAYTCSIMNLKRSFICNNAFASGVITRNASIKHAVILYNSLVSASNLVIDYNSYYIPEGNPQTSIAWISGNWVNLSALRPLNSGDVHSIDSNPRFNSKSNLIPDHGSSLLNAGTPLTNFNSDFYDSLRKNTPTIGAYEIAIDSAGPAIQVVQQYLNTGSTLNRTITANIKDNTGVPLSGANKPRIYFRKMYNGAWQSTQGMLSAGNSRSGAWSFTIDASLVGGFSINDSVYYYIAAQDSSPANNVATAPSGGQGTNVNNTTTSTLFNYAIFAPVNGNYLVGASQTSPNFTTLTAAAAFIEGKIITGNVSFLIQADYDALLEPAFPIVLKPYLSDAQQGVHRITIKPGAGVNDTIISASPASSVFNIEGGACYTIDGSNNGSRSRNLTVIHNGNAPAACVVVLTSLGANKGAKNNVIKNLNILSGDNLAVNDLSKRGVGLSGLNNDSNTIEGNYIANVAYGIMRVAAPVTMNVGNVFKENRIGGYSPVTERISFAGMNLIYEKDAQVINNEIAYVGKKLAYNSVGDAAGIMLSQVQNTRVSGNKIHDVINEKGYSASGIQLTSSASGLNVISNNVLYNILGNSSVAGKGTSGILISASTNDSFLFNTISMQGDLDSAGLANATISAFGIFIASALNPVLNNNIINVDLASNNALTHAAYSIPTSFSWGTGSSDYNSVYINPANNKMRFARYGSAGSIITQAQWQALGQDANAKFIDPLFNYYDPTRTTLQPESPLVKAGIAITGINRDILDSLRRNPPTIGAYEYPQDQSGPRIDYTLIPNSRELNTLVLSNFATIKDTSGVNTTNGLRPRFYFKKTTEANVFGANNSAANGWKWVEAANVTSPFNFIVSYSLLNSALIAGDTIAYFVVAQDQTAGTYVSSNPLPGFEGNSVANMIKAPASPNRLLIVGLPMSGNYNIGAVQTAPNYKTITHALADLALRGVNGPVTLTLMDTLYSTAETFPLAVKAIEGVSALNTIVLRPGAGVNAKITSAASTGTMQLNNCSYFTIDGRQNSTGNTQSLKIIGTSTSALSVINLVNDARNNNILYTDVMGVLSASAGLGVIYISGTSFANGSDSNTIRNCDVHSASTSATPGTCISVFGNSSITQDQCSDYLTIDSCRIYDYSGSGFTSSGIQIGRGKGLKITNNRFYQTATRNFGLTSSSTPHQHRAIWYQNTMNDPDTSAGILITGNMIGGNGSSGNYTITGDHTFWGIDVDVYYSSKVSIQGNTLTRLNISCKTEQVEAAIGIKASGLNVLIGNETPNTIGSATVNGSILFTASAGGSGFTGIYVNNGRGLKMENNLVGGIDLASATASVGASFTGISVYGNTYGVIKNNVIGSKVLSSSINQLSTAASNTKTTRLRGMSFSGGGAQELLVDSNSIANINSNSTCNITNISNESDVSGIYVNGNSAAKLKVVRNRIFNLSSATLTNNTFKGNLNGVLVNAGTATISNNEIHSLRYTNATASNNYVFVTGVNILGGQVIVDANKIHSFSVNNAHNGSLLTLSGIYAFTNSTATISNNMIRLGLDENGSSVSPPCGIWGIVVRNETNGLCRVAHNSVYLGGVSNGTGSSITRAFTHLNNSTTVKDTIVNNIFSNMRVNSGSGIKHYTVYMYDYKNIYLNRNVYQKTASGIFGTANAMTSDTLDYKKGWVTSDNESVVADPQFVNPTGTASTFDLHLKTNVATAAEGSGYVFDVPADYDGEQRSTLSPVDIGADAGNFIKTDLLPPVIIYNPLERDTVAPQRFVGDVKITDGTGIDTAFNKRPRLYFKKRTNNNAFVGNTASDNGWKYVVANNTTSPFNFSVNYALLHGGGVVLNDTIDYFVTAQDSSVSANVSANPAYGFNATSVSNISSAPVVPNYYRIYHLQLNGLYNVGSGQTSPNFPTITAAVERMADVGITGKVIFNLTDNLYSSNETFPILINAINGASAQNTVTLKPGLPGTRIIGNTVTNSQLLELNNAAYFNVDGSVNGAGSRDLTIDNTGDGRAVFIYNTANSNLNDTIANAIMSGSGNSSALLISGTTDYLGLVVINNKFQASLNGVKVEGSRARGGLRILNNTFGDSLPENSLYTAGVNSVGAEGIHIIGNKVTNVKNQVGTTTYGIYASTLGGQVIGNMVENISDTGTYFSPNAYGIYVPGAQYMMNNFVSGITGNYSTGILGGTFVIHNTVNMYSRRGNALNTYTQSVALAAGGTIRSNILINSMASANPSSNTSNYLLLSAVPATSLDLAYNNYYNVPVNNTQTFIGYTASSFADWKTLTSDSTSRNVPVTFVSPSDLHLAGASIGDTNLKAPIGYALNDIDGDARNPVFTYMGADENTANPVPVKLLQFTAIRKAADVELNWSTASEKNNLGFDVERSVDGKRFEKIGFVKGTLASAVKSSYQTIDERAFENARSSTVYYRLKQLDVDGRYTYSDVAMVSNPLGRPLAMVAFPNPFNSSMKIRFTHDAENDDATLELRDLNGKPVYKANVKLKAGENELETGDLSALNAGMYFMSIVTPGKTAVIKVIKQ